MEEISGQRRDKIANTGGGNSQGTPPSIDYGFYSFFESGLPDLQAQRARLFALWCRREDSNLHILTDTRL
jgi:hypothetical protein